MMKNISKSITLVGIMSMILFQVSMAWATFTQSFANNFVAVIVPLMEMCGVAWVMTAIALYILFLLFKIESSLKWSFIIAFFAALGIFVPLVGGLILSAIIMGLIMLLKLKLDFWKIGVIILGWYLLFNIMQRILPYLTGMLFNKAFWFGFKLI